eukprot:scaffold27342_cov45-Attheya_sp.AAC.2
MDSNSNNVVWGRGKDAGGPVEVLAGTEDIICSDANVDDSSLCSSSSVDTQDAFLEMLGLPITHEIPSLAEDATEEDERERTITPEKTADVVATRIALPRQCSRYRLPPETCLAFTMDNVYSREECQKLIEMATSKTTGGDFQYITQASHTAPDGATYSVQLQNPNPHKLSVFHHAPTVTNMWNHRLKERIEKSPMLLQPFLERTQCGPPLGLNPRLRVLRYDSSDNDRFEPHFDATTAVGPQRQSLLTVLLYLNDGGGDEFDGGETLYLDSHISSCKKRFDDTDEYDSVTKVTPRAGTVVIFEHDLFHSGAPLLWGTKYVLRTDILFAVQDEPIIVPMDKIGPPDVDVPLNNGHRDEEHHETKANPLLVSDLCDQLELSNTEKGILEDMDMLEMTIESFLSPGITMLKMMLQDSLLQETSVDRLVHTAVDTINV